MNFNFKESSYFEHLKIVEDIFNDDFKDHLQSRDFVFEDQRLQMFVHIEAC